MMVLESALLLVAMLNLIWTQCCHCCLLHDSFYCTSMMFEAIIHFSTSAWILGAAECKLLPFLQGVSVCASIFTLTGVAVERCYSITSPLSKRMSAKFCRRICALIWLAAVVLNCPWIFTFQLKTTTGDDNIIPVDTTMNTKTCLYYSVCN